MMVVYEGTPEVTKNYLKTNGVVVIESTLKYPIVVQRFSDYYKLLREYEFDSVIITDVKDVVFIKNPFDFLGNNNSDIVLGGESIKIENMPWASNNYSKTFPLEYPRIKENVSVCAGVISGKSIAVTDLCLMISKFSYSSYKLYTTNEPPDQAALNVILDLNLINSIDILSHDDAFVTHMGVSLDDKHKEKLTELPPILTESGIVNSYGQIFSIVHQYDRFASINEYIKKRYDYI